MNRIAEPHVLVSSMAETERRTETRMTTALPVLEIEGTRLRLHDFSSQGFRAVLPKPYDRLGATGNGTIHISAAGHSVQKKIGFHVIHEANGTFGVLYETRETISAPSDTLF